MRHVRRTLEIAMYFDFANVHNNLVRKEDSGSSQEDADDVEVRSWWKEYKDSEQLVED